MYGVIAEDTSDCDVLKVLIRRLSRLNVAVHLKGYGGCGELLKKGARQLRAYAEIGCGRFVVCYDADGPDPTHRRAEIVEKIVGPSTLQPDSCIAIVPVQELEAWILADLASAIPKVITSWHPNPVVNPESIPSPKEHLLRLSKSSNKRPRYIYTVHNKVVAEHLDLDAIYQKCPSFRPLLKFVRGPRGLLPKELFPGPDRSIWLGSVSSTEHRYHGMIADTRTWQIALSAFRDAGPVATKVLELCEYGCADRESVIDQLSEIIPKFTGPALQVLRSLQAAAAQVAFSHLTLDDGTR